MHLRRRLLRLASALSRWKPALSSLSTLHAKMLIHHNGPYATNLACYGLSVWRYACAMFAVARWPSRGDSAHWRSRRAASPAASDPHPHPGVSAGARGTLRPPFQIRARLYPFFCAIEIVRILPFSELITCRAPQRLRLRASMAHLWRGCAIAPLNYRRKFYGAPRFAPSDFLWRTYGALYGAYTYGCPSAENRPMRSLR